MSTRPPRFHTDAEPSPNHTATRPQTPPTSSATARAPQTFSHRSGSRLQNLVDEFNAAMPGSRSE
ncbi:hypothetical protein [Halopiger goleimassiliensis]|uniref:hypothetical protein n=1 Tax=Halopiger goleimassiliensis TaxID=1293048 RepID=UPI000677DC9C|nr:hypothetical protein [Halopiger goleimassiliensis]